jgi:soluble P-type ATPase
MQTNRTSIAATLQKLIDHGVDIVCADYDESGSIKTRALALMNSGALQVKSFVGQAAKCFNMSLDHVSLLRRSRIRN